MNIFNRINVFGGMIIAHIGRFRMMLSSRKGMAIPAKIIYLDRNVGRQAAPPKDSLTVVPYTFWNPKSKAVDPINIVVWGLTPEEFIVKILRRNSAWLHIRKSYQYLFVQHVWCTSWTQIVKNVPDNSGRVGIRYHMRLFMAYSNSGVPVTLGNAHFEYSYDGGHQIISWDEARDEVMRDLALVPQACTYIADMYEPSWRGFPSDGRAVLLRFVE